MEKSRTRTFRVYWLKVFRPRGLVTLSGQGSDKIEAKGVSDAQTKALRRLRRKFGQDAQVLFVDHEY